MLTARQWATIHARQARELDTLLGDRALAERLSLTKQYSQIGRWLEPGLGGDVLELGCGPGRYVALLSQLGFRVTGVDQSAAASIPTWQRIRTLPGVSLRDGVLAESLPFEDGAFDHVACMSALLYFNDAEKALREIHRVLKPDGRLIVRTVNRRSIFTAATGKFSDPASKNLYTEEELRDRLRSHGFEVKHSFGYGFLPPMATQYWWYLIHTAIGSRVQNALSALTPSRNGWIITVFATRLPGKKVI